MLNIFRTKRAFEVKYNAFFITFKGLSVTKNCLRPESVPLNENEVPRFCRMYQFKKPELQIFVDYRFD